MEGPGQPAIPDASAGDLSRPRWPQLSLWSMGLLAGPAFFYAGIKAQQRRWLAFGFLYSAVAAIGMVVTTPSADGSLQEAIGASIILLLWGVGTVHAYAVRDEYARRVRLLADPSLDVAERRVLRREKARALAVSDPARARELGVGRPDIRDGFDGGLVDLNNAPAGVIARLPGFDEKLAERVVATRGRGAGYTSLDDLDLVLDLPVETLAEIRDEVVFLPRSDV